MDVLVFGVTSPFHTEALLPFILLLVLVDIVVSPDPDLMI